MKCVVGNPADWRGVLVDMSNLNKDGYEVVTRVLEDPMIEALLSALTVEAGRGGNRQVQDPLVDEIAWRGVGADLARRHLGQAARPVRILYFDKSPSANWSVPYHQDVTIAVDRRGEADGYGPWSVKAGVVHVQPPADVLEGMLAVRLHLDPCPVQNGALRVVPGTHRKGKLSHAAIEQAIQVSEEVHLPVDRGDAILMKPLLLHASSPSQTPAHRRVLHIEYADRILPTGFAWALGDLRGDSSIIGQLPGGIDHQ